MSYVGKVTAGGATHLVGSTLYGTCNTSATTADKVVVCSNFDQLINGVTIYVKFSNSDLSTSNPTLNVNSTGAKTIVWRSSGNGQSTMYGLRTYSYHGNTFTPAAGWLSGQVRSFTYDGTYWVLTDTIGDELRDIFLLKGEAQTLTSAQKRQVQDNIGLTRIISTEVTIAASAWTEESTPTYSDFPFMASISIAGVTSSLYPEVVFSPEDALSGNYAPVAVSGTDAVYIYAKANGAVAMTIPTIIVH